MARKSRANNVLILSDAKNMMWKAGLYSRLSVEDGDDTEQNSIGNQELLCRGWFLPPNTYDCGSFVVNGTAVVGKEPQKAL